MTTNYLTRLASNANKSDLWKTYGFIIEYIGTGKFKSVVSEKKLFGIYNTDFNISNGTQLVDAAGSGSVNKIAKTVINSVTHHYIKISKLNDFIKEYAKQKIGKSISESIEVYEGGNGRPKIDITTYFIPGLFGFKSYDVLEQWAAYSTLPLNVAGQKTGYSQYLYSKNKIMPGGFIDLSSDLFSIKLNNLIHIPGGMYITNFSRTYSNDRDENGKPIFCRVDISLEYYRQMFADEFVNLFSEF